jgi:hypothetical protein
MHHFAVSRGSSYDRIADRHIAEGSSDGADRHSAGAGAATGSTPLAPSPTADLLAHWYEAPHEDPAVPYSSWGALASCAGQGFTVYRLRHWAFAGTEPHYGDVIGGEAGIFGNEVDGLDYTFRACRIRRASTARPARSRFWRWRRR